jgi:putative nucleotide binding protein
MSRDESRYKKFEDYGYVLDYLPRGKPISSRGIYRAEPIIQLVGEAYYTLLEATPRSGIDITHGERVYVGKDRIRAKVGHIISRVSYDDLTVTAKSELPVVLEEIVAKHEDRYVHFFNNAQPVTPRMHSLELIPGIGKKYTRTILDLRDRRAFSSFKDVKDRVQVPDPVKLIAKRILEELSAEPKYRIFTRPP